MKISNRLVENVVRRVLLEYGGVSDEILSLANDIYSKMIAEYNSGRNDWERLDSIISIDGFEYVKYIYLQLFDNEYVESVNVKLYGYNPRQTTFMRAYNYLRRKGMARISYSSLDKCINFFIPFPINGEVTSKARLFIISGLNHEIKHGLRYVKQLQNLERKGKDFTFDENYYASVTGVQKGIYGNDENTVLAIKDLYYYLCTDEIDARLQSMYVEYSEYMDLSKCRSYYEVKSNEEVYEQFKYAISISPTFRKRFDELVRDVFNNRMNAKKFLNYCQKGINRFDEHLRRIIGRVTYEKRIN